MDKETIEAVKKATKDREKAIKEQQIVKKWQRNKKLHTFLKIVI